MLHKLVHFIFCLSFSLSLSVLETSVFIVCHKGSAWSFVPAGIWADFGLALFQTLEAQASPPARHMGSPHRPRLPLPPSNRLSAQPLPHAAITHPAQMINEPRQTRCKKPPQLLHAGNSPKRRSNNRNGRANFHTSFPKCVAIQSCHFYHWAFVCFVGVSSGFI